MIFLLLILFLLTRLVNLTLMPVFVDEAIYIRWSQLMWNGQKLRLLSLDDGKQPLFMLLNIPTLAIFQDPLFAGRLVSVLAGFAAVLGIYLFAKEFISKKVALLSVVFYIFAPFTLFYDRLAVVDGLLSALGVWSLYISFKFYKTNKKIYALFLALVFGMALWTKTPGLFFIILTFFTPFVFLPAKPKINYWSYWLLSGLIGFGIYNILRVSKAFYQIASRNSDYVYSFSDILKRGLVNPLIPNFTSSISWMRDYLTIGIFILSIISIIYIFVKKNKVGILLFLWFIVPVLSGSLISKAFTARYILISIPYLLIISSILLVKINKYFLILIIILLPALNFDFYLWTNIEKAPIPQRERSGYLEEWSAGGGIKEVSEYLINVSKTENYPKIYVMTEGYVGTLPDGISIYTHKYNNIQAFGIGWPVGSYPPQLKEYLNVAKVYLVVNESRMKLPSTDNLKLIKKYPKPYSINPQDFLLLYEVLSERK